MTSKEQFAPLCDLHHTPMQRRMLEEDTPDIRSFHACGRSNCTRVFREGGGYSDWVDGAFDEDRSNVRPCPTCTTPLYLAAVDHVRKVETWECPQSECEFDEDAASPSGR